MILYRDPIALVTQAAMQAFPDLRCDMDFMQVIDCDPEALGVTIWPDDGGVPQVFIRLDLTIEQAVEIIAHELAHVAAGQEAGHDEAWLAAFDAIGKQWESLLDEPHSAQKDRADG